MADLALVLMMAIWGSSFAIVRLCLVGSGELHAIASPLALLAARMALASLLVVGGLPATANGRALLARLWAPGTWGQGGIARDGLACGILLAIGFVLQTEGLPRTSASRSGFLTSLLVAFVPLIELVFFRKRPAPPALVALAITLMGLALLSGPLTNRGGTLTGDLLTIGCAIAFAGQIVVLAHVVQRHPVSLLLLIQLVSVGVVSAAVGPVIEETRLVAQPSLWAAIVYLGLFPTLLAFAVQTWAQRRVTPVRLALISSLEPVFAALVAAPLLNERMSRRELGGAGLIVLGVIIGEPGSAWWARRSVAGKELGDPVIARQGGGS